MRHIAILDTERPTYYVEIPKPGYSQNESLYEWLDNTSGAGYSFGGHGIYFYREKDAMWFALRWAS